MSRSRFRGPVRLRRLVTVLIAVVVVAGGCASGAGGSRGGADEPVTITVMAAASLTDAFTEIGELFEKQNENVAVQLSFAGSATLVEQIQSGAPADVFASADTENMDKLGDEAVDAQGFASNTLEIAVPAGNPADVTSFADLAKPDLNLVICAPEVPCGSATRKVVEATGVDLSPVSLEQSVTDVLGKVASGEADAGVVYTTDLVGAGDQVEAIELPTSVNERNTYAIATVAGTQNTQAARKFVEFVLGDGGQQVLGDRGFGAP